MVGGRRSDPLVAWANLILNFNCKGGSRSLLQSVCVFGGCTRCFMCIKMVKSWNGGCLRSSSAMRSNQLGFHLTSYHTTSM